MTTKKSGGSKSANKKSTSKKSTEKEEAKEIPLLKGGAGTAGDSEGDSKVQQLREENDIDLASTALGSGSGTDGLSGSDTENDNEIPLSKGDSDDSEIPQLSAESQRAGSGVCIVIPFKESASAANELLYTLRAWDKFLPGCVVLLVGDFPEWANPNKVGHIVHTATSKNPQVDVAQKLLEVCKCPLQDGRDNAEHVTGGVPDYFIISNDDIYPVAPLTITDLDLHTAMGRLGQRGSAGSLYRKNAANTLESLKAAGIKAPFDYATHTPVGVWKKELAEVIERFKADKVGHLVTTLYFNTVWPDHRPILVDNGASAGNPGTQSYVASVYRKVPPASVKKAFQERKFINNNDAGWSSVEPFLKKLFPDKSRFEK